MSYRASMNLLDASYPRLASLYERMMNSARIIRPPSVFVSPETVDVFCDVQSGKIFVGERYLKSATFADVEASTGHETGHILAEHGTTIWTPKEIRRAHEHEADRIAVHLTGSHDKVSAMRRDAYITIGEEYRPSFKRNLEPGSWSETLARKLDNLSPRYRKNLARTRADSLQNYGTPEEMEANIRGVDLNDRMHLEALIERRNARSHLIRD